MTRVENYAGDGPWVDDWLRGLKDLRESGWTGTPTALETVLLVAWHGNM